MLVASFEALLFAGLEVVGVIHSPGPVEHTVMISANCCCALTLRKSPGNGSNKNSDLAQLLWAEMLIREYEKLGDPASVWALVADEKGEEIILPSNRVFVPITKQIRCRRRERYSISWKPNSVS